MNWYLVLDEWDKNFYDGEDLNEAKKIAKIMSMKEKTSLWVIDYNRDVEVALYKKGKEI